MSVTAEANEYRQDVLTVTELTHRVKSLLESAVGSVWVSGEISNLRVPSSGHMYFTLKDEACHLAAVMFRGRNRSLRFRPDNGLEVVLHGSVTVYESRGQYQIIVDQMEPRGVGALQLAFEQLKKKLDEEGLFDQAHKIPIPALPRRIGVVTSLTGAAIRDILTVVRRRFSGVHLLLCPVRVQGDQAPPEIADGIRALDALGDIDVIIVGRGGGSIEDLWAFNDEGVARAIYESTTPVISAVGHEIDFTISDFVADLRAATPSAAAELVVGEREAMRDNVVRRRQRLALAMRRTVETARHRMRLMQESYVLLRPDHMYRDRQQRLDDLSEMLHRGIHDELTLRRSQLERLTDAVRHLRPQLVIARNSERLDDTIRRFVVGYRCVLGDLDGRCANLVAKLDGLSPLGVLARGYSLVRTHPDGRLVNDVSRVTVGDKLGIQFHRGAAIVGVEETAVQ